jgi:zinc D-Ala-D-Ala dipeptidase
VGFFVFTTFTRLHCAKAQPILQSMKMQLKKVTSKVYSLMLFCLILVAVSCYSQSIANRKSKKLAIADTTFVNLQEYSKDFVYDMKYATANNFLKEQVYDCASCLLRWKTIKALMAANKDFMEMSYKIKIFDCYRPLDIQKKMWKIVSNPSYVADPKKGSIHNRGGAVDITIVDNTGKDLDMGTAFDFFGAEAGHNYPNLSDEVKKNRSILKTTMLKNGFSEFESEWWHYNLKSALNDKIANVKWKCN